MNISRENKLHMNGSAVFNFTATTVVDFIKSQSLNLNNYKIIFHQANSFKLNYMRKKLHVSQNNFNNEIYDIGNTVSSSIPFAISRNIEELKTQDLFLCGFGIGLSYSSVLIIN